MSKLDGTCQVCCKHKAAFELVGYDHPGEWDSEVVMEVLLCKTCFVSVKSVIGNMTVRENPQDSI